MNLSRIQTISLAWLFPIAVAALATHFVADSLNIVFAVWGVGIFTSIILTAITFRLEHPQEREIWLGWTILSAAVFLANILGFYVPSLSWILGLNVYVLWSVVIGIGYYFTSVRCNWPLLTALGAISVLSAVLYVLAPLADYQALVFGVVQCILLAYMAFKK